MCGRELGCYCWYWENIPSPRAHIRAAALFSSSEPQTARLDRFALIVPDELLHFLANVSPSAIGKERNEGKSLPPWRCHFHTLRLAACQQTGHSKEVEWTHMSNEKRSRTLMTLSRSTVERTAMLQKGYVSTVAYMTTDKQCLGMLALLSKHVEHF